MASSSHGEIRNQQACSGHALSEIRLLTSDPSLWWWDQAFGARILRRVRLKICWLLWQWQGATSQVTIASGFPREINWSSSLKGDGLGAKGQFGRSCRLVGHAKWDGRNWAKAGLEKSPLGDGRTKLWNLVPSITTLRKGSSNNLTSLIAS